MIFDVATRHRLALDPAGLTSISVTLTAMMRAIEDCRNAGVAPDSDPAVVLLARHMATISPNRAPRAILEGACRRKLADIARFPALLALAARRVEYDSIAKDRFHAEGRAALSALAYALNLDVRSYELTTILGERSDAGCLRLATRHSSCCCASAALTSIVRCCTGRCVMAARSHRTITPRSARCSIRTTSPGGCTRIWRYRPAPACLEKPAHRRLPQAATSSISQEPDHAGHRLLANAS
jgi:hypothetical protein